MISDYMKASVRDLSLTDAEELLAFVQHHICMSQDEADAVSLIEAFDVLKEKYDDGTPMFAYYIGQSVSVSLSKGKSDFNIKLFKFMLENKTDYCMLDIGGLRYKVYQFDFKSLLESDEYKSILEINDKVEALKYLSDMYFRDNEVKELMTYVLSNYYRSVRIICSYLK